MKSPQADIPVTPRLAMIELAASMNLSLDDPGDPKPMMEIKARDAEGTDVVTINVKPCLAGPLEGQRAILGAKVTLHEGKFDLAEGQSAVQSMGGFVRAQREGAQQAVEILGLSMALSWPPETLNSLLVV